MRRTMSQQIGRLIQNRIAPSSTKYSLLSREEHRRVFARLRVRERSIHTNACFADVLVLCAVENIYYVQLLFYPAHFLDRYSA